MNSKSSDFSRMNLPRLADCAIVGVADSSFGQLHDHSYLSLSAELLRLAMEDAGGDWDRLDGLLVSSSQVTYYNRPALALAEYAGICEQLHFAGGPELGGASPFTAVIEAVALISSGLCEMVAIVSCDIPRTGQDRATSVRQFGLMRDADYERPYGLTNPGAYALLASTYQSKYRVSDRLRASVAVAHRKHAQTNPAATYRDQLSIDEVLESKVIASPLHMLECRPIVDGGAAIVISRHHKTDRARGVNITGLGFGSAYDQINQVRNLEIAAGSRLAGKRALQMAGIGFSTVPNAIDTLCIYDSYTITALLQLEALGICKEGSAGHFYAEGETGLDGAMPTNTNGGLLSHGGPGICLITEAVRQLRHQAVNQVSDASRALVSGEGGILSANTALVLEV